MDVLLERDKDELPATWKFASWADVGLLQGWAEFLGRDSSGGMRDSADFARQAVVRWLGYADKHLTVGSLDEAGQKGLNSDEEFVALLVLKADLWLNPEHPLAFVYVRRTWCGGLYLEFMAGHPLAEGSIKGVLRATIQCLSNLAETTGGEWIWWEATKDSFPKYEGINQGIIAKTNVLSSTEPRVKDLFVVRAAQLQSLLKQIGRAT